MDGPRITGLPLMFPGGLRIGAEEEAAVIEVLRSKRLFRYYGAVEGPSVVAAFEADFSRTMGTTHALAVSSGTLALAAALAAAGVGPGDQVIVPAYTWVATAAAVLAVGAVPVIAEIDEALGLDAGHAGSLVNERTRAVIAVHMRGAPADMDAIGALARRHGLVVIEDVAQAMGGSYRGRRLGTIGDLGCFSLQYNKIITAGEGGVVVSDDPDLFARAQMFHDVATGLRGESSDVPVFYGITCRMSELQGAVARVQLTRLEGILADCRANRSAIVGQVADAAAAKGIRLRRSHDEAGDTAIALVLLCADTAQAGALASGLREAGLDADTLFDPDTVDLHIAAYWRPVLEARTWSSRGPWTDQAGDLAHAPDRWPRSEALLSRAVHLDVSPDLTGEQVELVAGALRDVLDALPEGLPDQ